MYENRALQRVSGIVLFYFSSLSTWFFCLGNFLSFQSTQFIWCCCFPFMKTINSGDSIKIGLKIQPSNCKYQGVWNLPFLGWSCFWVSLLPRLCLYPTRSLTLFQVPPPSSFPADMHRHPCTPTCACMLTHVFDFVLIGKKGQHQQGWAAGLSGLNLSCLGDLG